MALGACIDANVLTWLLCVVFSYHWYRDPNFLSLPPARLAYAEPFSEMVREEARPRGGDERRLEVWRRRRQLDRSEAGSSRAATSGLVAEVEEAKQRAERERKGKAKVGEPEESEGPRDDAGPSSEGGIPGVGFTYTEMLDIAGEMGYAPAEVEAMLRSVNFDTEGAYRHYANMLGMPVKKFIRWAANGFLEEESASCQVDQPATSSSTAASSREGAGPAMEE